jgi:hypothetical protein
LVEQKDPVGEMVSLKVLIVEMLVELKVHFDEKLGLEMGLVAGKMVFVMALTDELQVA